ncbi:MAG: hypothetical protein Q8R40_03450 [bacterium]|nr:hypothetical protein [bacterium]
MARTLEDGFNTFLSWLTPTETESANAKSHRASIKARLEADFNMKRFFWTGSFGNGTSISSYSDVDYFASLPQKKLKQSAPKSPNLKTKQAAFWKTPKRKSVKC